MAILDKYYNRYDVAKKYTKTKFLASRGLQSAELNEIQEYAEHAIREVGDAIFSNGDVISGCTCVVNGESGAVTVEAGKIYLKGLIRDVHEGILTIPTDETVRIGVYFKEQTITELEDPSLRDPATGTRNFQEVGAARLQYTMAWDYLAEEEEFDSARGEFYTVYTVENGVLVQTSVAPQLETVSNALARYDEEGNGSYLVRGMTVLCTDADDESQTFCVKAGKAHVNGYEVEFSTALNKAFEAKADVQTVTSDPYVFEPNSQGIMEIKLNYAPIQEIISVDVTAEKTVTMTHGSYLGAWDPIPSSAVLEIMEVKQGSKVYSKGTDYKLTAGQVEWGISGGTEPAPGSTYKITYRYRTQVAPTDVSSTGFKISGAVEGTMVLVSYTWKMPRYDLITIDSSGIVRRVKGLAHAWSPAIPAAPTGQLVLAQVYQKWDGLPSIKNTAVQAITMNELESMRKTVDDLYYLLAELQLKVDANASDPSTKKGMFVDSFRDDAMRDQGIEQTAAIFDGKLCLPTDFEVKNYATSKRLYLLPYELEEVITQELRTGSMKVNPYNAYDPIPAEVELSPNVDKVPAVTGQWTSTSTSYFWRGLNLYGTATKTQTTAYDTATMRQADVAFKINGFKTGEKIKLVLFNGVDITESVSVDE